MTPKEKAKELIDRFVIYADFEPAKEIALIAVNLVISSNPHSNPFNTAIHSTMKYWGEVKKEIEQL